MIILAAPMMPPCRRLIFLPRVLLYAAYARYYCHVRQLFATLRLASLSLRHDATDDAGCFRCMLIAAIGLRDVTLRCFAGWPRRQIRRHFFASCHY